jgi:hypothetical protein
MHALHLLHAIRKFIHIERHTMNAITPQMIISSFSSSSLLLNTLSPPKKGQFAVGGDFDATSANEQRQLAKEQYQKEQHQPNKGFEQQQQWLQQQQKYAEDRKTDTYGKNGEFRQITP